MARQFPEVEIAPYSQPPTITFYSADGDIIDVHDIHEDTSLPEIMRLIKSYGLGM